MATFAAISAASTSLVRLLNRAFTEQQPITGSNTRAVLVRTNDFRRPDTTIGTPRLSVFLYRVEFNKTVRAAWAGVGSARGLGHAPLDLSFLLTAWAENAEHEALILGRAVQALDETPSLAGPLLYPTGVWAANETVQVLPDDAAGDMVLRLFDMLPTDYRLSLTYTARVVRVDGRRADPDPPVTTVVLGERPGVEP